MIKLIVVGKIKEKALESLIQDYISGMTDLYAYDEYRRLMAAE